VRTTGDTGAVVKCQAGCRTEDVLGEWPGGPFTTAALFDQFWEPVSEIEAAYDYIDEAGQLLFQVVRKTGKKFVQRRPDGAGGWIWKLGSTRRVLYRLPRVAAAVQAGETVYVAEGEKDVHALEAAGVTATCNPGGAGKWRDEYAALFKGGARAVVVADRDEPGRAHAATVAASLRNDGALVTIVEAAEGKDAADHLRAGRTVEGFVEIPARADTNGSGGGSALPPFVVDMREAMRTANDPIPCIVDPIAVRGALTALIGRHSSRKSWLCMLTAAAVHTGKTEIAGMPVTAGRALYIDGEMGDRMLAKRFAKAGLDAGAMVVGDGMKLRLPGADDSLRQLIRDAGADLVVIDSLRRLTGAEENNSDQMAPLIGQLALITRELNVAIVLIHHRSSKPGSAESRGSSAIEDQVDIAFALERLDGDPEGDDAGERRPVRRRLRTLKYRLAEEPPPRWLSMGAAPLGLFSICETESFIDVEKAPRIPMAERLVQEIRGIADQIPADGWSRKEIADEIVIGPRKGSLGDALGILVAREGWTKVGNTSSRRYAPPKGAR
jgi:hypothetical protein